MIRLLAIGFFILGLVSCQTNNSLKADSQQKLVDAIFDTIQYRSFQYFYEAAEPISGMARERFHVDGVYPQNDAHIITSGGSGFGMMAMIVGMERNFITREQGLAQLNKMISFIEKADKFNGVFPHWWNGETGEVKPFSPKDDGADIVETSFLAQGLLCVRQYFRKGNEQEKELAKRADSLWRNINFQFHTRGENVLYWHWSPKHNWAMNFKIRGYNECLITYVLAASSPTFPIDPIVYHEGWADNGNIIKSRYYGEDSLQLFYQGDPPQGGPLFWAHYSYLGLDPNGLIDQYAHYEKEVKAQARINYRWCIDNPLGYPGYSDSSWGLTASYSINGYAAHAPNEKEDKGVISPTAALSSFPYTPNASKAAMVYWYENYKENLLGPYGFYDAFSIKENWFPKRYLAIDQGPIVVMMENFRTGLLWKLFMSCEEVQTGLKKLSFTSPYLK